MNIDNVKNESFADRLEKVKELLTKHHYIVNIKQTDESGYECEAQFPHTPKKLPLFNETQTKFKYEIHQGDASSHSGVYINGEFWAAPTYAHRLLIFSDILRLMKKFPLPEPLINFYDVQGEVKKNITDIMVEPNDEENKEKEIQLSNLLEHAIFDGFSQEYEEKANLQGIYQGYRILRGFFV